MYRRLREQMRNMPKEVQDQFEKFIQTKVTSGDQCMQTEERKETQKETHESTNSPALLQNEIEYVEDSLVDVSSAIVTPKRYKRGDRISFNSCPGYFLEYTPSGSRGKVTLRGNNTKPLRIPLREIGQVEKLEFDGEYFMIAGKYLS